VRHEQALQNAADARAGRTYQQVKMIAQQAITVELERLALLQFAERVQKRLKVARFAKHILPIVATIDHVVN